MPLNPAAPRRWFIGCCAWRAQQSRCLKRAALSTHTKPKWPLLPCLPCVQPIMIATGTGSSAGLFLPDRGPGAPPPSSITFLQMLLAGILYSASTQAASTQPDCLAIAADALTAALEAAWPTSTDQARPAITRHLFARHWVPDPEQPAATEHGGATLRPTAAALQRDLRRHAPESSLSLVELRSSVLLKRALWAANASGRTRRESK